jgi:hypothetical protein
MFLKTPKPTQCIDHISLSSITRLQDRCHIFSVSFRRTGFGFPFSFSFYGYHFMFYTISLKTEDFDTFPLPWLVNIWLDGLICWTVGLNGVIWVHSALVGWPGDIPSIERPDDEPIPESFLAAEVPRRGLDDTGPTSTQDQWRRIVYFYLYFRICSFCFPFSLISDRLAQEYACNHMYVVSPMLFCI